VGRIPSCNYFGLHTVVGAAIRNLLEQQQRQEFYLAPSYVKYMAALTSNFEL
jgi:hypothetical protein